MSAAEGFVVPAGSGKRFDSPPPGRSFAMKLLGRETDESIMMFEETLPAGTASLYHLHRDSDEVAWVLAGEFTFKIADEVAVGGGPALAHSCHATSRMPGRIPAVKRAASCFSTPPPPPEASSRRSRSAARSTTTNAPNSTSATAGKSSAQTRFEGAFARGVWALFCAYFAPDFCTS